jgi:alpha-tubulin suppressor-like RCC1 family protein
VLESGAVRCWGLGTTGRLGYGNSRNIGDDEKPSAAGDVNLGAAAVAVSAGYTHTCALLEDGSVRCWGLGSSGQLGTGNTSSIGDNEVPSSVPAIALGASASAVVTGQSHSCALLESGHVRCWGLGRHGALGYGNTDNVGDDEDPALAGDLDLGGRASSLVAGQRHSCALLENHTLTCWGYSADGVLGSGTRVTVGDDEAPSSVGTLELAGAVFGLSSTAKHACALVGQGVQCWGDGSGGKLGLGDLRSWGDDEALAELPWVSLAGSP